MQTSAYAAISGQVALEQRLAVLAHNVANAGTAGFRAEGISFDSVVTTVSDIPSVFALQSGSHAVETAGALMRTGNPLDVAIQGRGFIALQTTEGIVYTRDGRMQVTPTGDLVSLNGHPVLDVSGAPLVVDPGVPIDISRDGMITQNQQQLGALGLFHLDLSKPYQRDSNAGLRPSARAEPVVTFATDGVVQGFSESSNVNPVLEMTNLIAITRAFEAVASALEQNDASLKNAVQALGGRS